MAGQTDYSTSPTVARAGDSADSDNKRIQATLADGTVTIGLLAQFKTAGVPGDQVPATTEALPALAVDVDAIVTTLASVASATVLTGAGLTGVVGALRMSPARRITLILNSHANWDAGTWVVRGRDIDGQHVEESIAVADAGAATYTTRYFYQYVDSIAIPAQAGTGGSMTVGITADEGEYARGAVGVVFRDPTKPYGTADTYLDEEDCPMFMGGAVMVTVEAAVTRGMKCYVRTAESGADVRGQFRGDPATGFSLLRHAHFDSDGDVDGLAILYMDL